MQNLESLATILAIFLGGIWTYMLFIKNREKFPKADITHKIEQINRKNDVILRLTVGIENLGKVKLPVNSGEVRLQQIKPQTATVVNAIKSFRENKSSKKREIEWPVLEERILNFGRDEYELEPTEKENFEFDFILDQEINVIQFYTHIENVFKTDKGWNYTSIHELN